MKTRITILLLMVAFAFSGSAQSVRDYVEVVHLKNGSVVKGVIIEQVPGQSVKIKTADGKELVYSINEIAKFSREKAVAPTTADGKTCDKSGKTCSKDKGAACCASKDYNKKGMFVEVGVLGGTGAYGFRVTPGYRFGKKASLGLAFGIESVNIKRSFNSIPELSLNLVYSGDILDRKITPFYQLEAGYGFSLDRYGYNKGKFDFDKGAFFGKAIETMAANSDEISTLNYGGPMGALALGVKFNTSKKVYYKLGLDARLTSNFADVHTVSAGLKNVYTVNPSLGARFSFGF